MQLSSDASVTEVLRVGKQASTKINSGALKIHRTQFKRVEDLCNLTTKNKQTKQTLPGTVYKKAFNPFMCKNTFIPSLTLSGNLGLKTRRN